MSSKEKINELARIVGNKKIPFIEAIDFIEKNLDPTWIRFKERVQKFKFPFIAEDFNPKVFNVFIDENYFSTIGDLRIIYPKNDYTKVNESGKIEEFAPNTEEGWIQFNNYIINEYFPTLKDIIKDFDKRIVNIEHPPLFLDKEINRYIEFSLTKPPLDFDFSFLDTEFIRTGVYDWRIRFDLAFQSVVNTGISIEFNRYVRLPDLYFLHLGTIYGLYFNHLNNLIMNNNKKTDPNSLNTIGEKILFLKYSGVLAFLKKKIKASTDLDENLLKTLSVLVDEKVDSLKPVINGLNKRGAEINKNNPYSKQNCNKVEPILRKLNFDKEANLLNKDFKKISLTKP
jgi:hypothetical protein